jgi:pyruvate formate lyase activating enzyme
VSAKPDDIRADYWSPAEDGAVRCALCPHCCVVRDGEAGRCGVRQNRGGQLVAATYGLLATAQMDPIEKKPLWHYYPGREILSVGTWGCNLRCRYCQNAHLSRGFGEGAARRPEDLLAAAAREPGNIGVAFTYNEPLIWFEYVRDAAKLLRGSGLRVVLVTNGFVNPEPLEELLPLVDAANVDLKSMEESFYRDLCDARLAPVLEALKLFHKHTHLEVTKLLVTGHGDPVADADAVARWIAEELSPDVPLHLSRYFPRHEWTSPETRESTLHEAVGRARAHLHFVYAGNTRAAEASATVCPDCGKTVVRREGYRVSVTGLAPGGLCSGCGRGLGFHGV